MNPKTSARSRRILRVRIALFVVVAAIATLAVVADQWRKKDSGVHVIVSGTTICTAEELRALAAIPDTATLANLDLLRIQHRIERHPFVRRAVLRRDPPGRLVVEITERTPLAILLNIHARDWLLDEDGIALPNVREASLHDLPVITGWQPVRDLVPGAKIADPRILQALQILTVARTMEPPLLDLISEVSLEHQNDLVLFTLEGSLPVIIGDAVDAERKLRSFRTYWESVALQTDVRRLEYVDLRFKDQVVVRMRNAADSTGTTARPDTTSLQFD